MRSSSDISGQGRSITNDQNQIRSGDLRDGPYQLSIVGLGSNGDRGLTEEAIIAIKEAEIVLGYNLYLKQAEKFISLGAQVVSSTMTEEIKRSQMAIDLALSGRKVALVSGGDPGVYAMSGALFELAAELQLSLGTNPGQLLITVVSGTTAVTAAAALLGAPLTHDFCTISLSDRLTDWETIVFRLDLASRAGFVIALYNPKSRGRDWQLSEAVKVLLKNLTPSTPVGIVSRVGRFNQQVSITDLERLPEGKIDMQTIVIVGNSS
ncbi:MAG: precorrin-3B C(17)-methyltransferase, partial [Deltaproteobacteria bacterium]|nr:precorrin-3B C(17)-methyltransferase [Deltaproteobacteria bacterium]